MTAVRFGTYVPQGWNGELARWRDEPGAQWDVVVGTARAAEELGFDLLCTADHLVPAPVPTDAPVFECYTTLTALAAATSRVRLGQMATCAGYRNAALLAKLTSNVDVISGGRLELCLGAGWYEAEYRAYGYDFPSAVDRIALLEETVELVTALWTEPTVTMKGRFVRADDARCDPKPLQRPRPPVWVAGSGPNHTLRVVARLADVSNFGGPPSEFAATVVRLDEHCARVGRDAGEIAHSWSGSCLIRDEEREVRRLYEEGTVHGVHGLDYETWRDRYLVGTPDHVAGKVAALVEAGATIFVPWFADLPDQTTMRIFADRVIGAFR